LGVQLLPDVLRGGEVGENRAKVREDSISIAEGTEKDVSYKIIPHELNPKSSSRRRYGTIDQREAAGNA
jgi:hypothetical protein